MITKSKLPGFDLTNAGSFSVPQQNEPESFLQYQQRVNPPQPQQQPNPPPSPTSAPASNPWAQWGLDPTRNQAAGQSGSKDQAMAGLRYAAQQEGINVDDAMLNAAANAAGYSGNGPVSGDQYNRALAYLRSQKTPPAPGGGSGPQPGVSIQAPAPYKPSTPAPGALPAHMLVPAPQFAQYSARTPVYDAGVDSIVNSILANPGTMGPDVTNAMKTRAKENAVAQSASLRGDARRDLAGRGFLSEGGTSQAVDAAYDQALIDSLINANVGIDIEAASKNRQDTLDAVGLAEAVLSGRVGRDTQEYGATLAGQDAQATSDFRRDNLREGQRQFDSTYGLQKWGAEEGMNLTSADSALRAASFLYDQVRDDRSQTLQELLGEGGLELDRERLAQQADQFRQATGLDLLRLIEQSNQFGMTFGEGQRQFNNTLARLYGLDNQNQQNSLIDYLMRVFNQR